MIKITRTPFGFTVAYKRTTGDRWTPICLDDLKLPDDIVQSVVSDMNNIIKFNELHITHFEYGLGNVKFFKDAYSCFCRGPSVYTLLDNAEIIKQKLDKIRELL